MLQPVVQRIMTTIKVIKNMVCAEGFGCGKFWRG